jgi:non-specific serine/threonine protein kinase
VQDPALVPAAVARALDIQLPPGAVAAESMPAVLAQRQLLLVLDNCEHLLEAAADQCAAILRVADDVRVLATSREPLGADGEACYRLAPLGLPQPDDAAGAVGSEAVMLFADRARRADPHFALSPESAGAVAGLVARLDGMPLAIELAAARIEALSVTELAGHFDEWLRLLTAKRRDAADRHRSLAAAAEWSYRLLNQAEQRVFRQLAVFPGPFTLAGAEAVGGSEAGSAVLRLVDCSLLVPPRVGNDGRARYLMLDTLRGYAAQRLAEADGGPDAAARLAGHALQVAEQAAAAIYPTGAGELAGLRWLDAEEATVLQGLTWALEHDEEMALRLAVAQAPWWVLRGRTENGYAQLRSAAGEVADSGATWCAAQYWLGVLASYSDIDQALDHYAAAVTAAEASPPSPTLVDCLANMAREPWALGSFPQARDTARRALSLARELGYPAGQVRALMALYWIATSEGRTDEALTAAREAGRIAAPLRGKLARMCAAVLARTLAEAGELDQARRKCAELLSHASEAGDLTGLADFLELAARLELQADDPGAAAAHVREGIEVCSRIGYPVRLTDFLELSGYLCAATQQWAEVVTLWAACSACRREYMTHDVPEDMDRRTEAIQRASQELGADRTLAAAGRGEVMTLATATEFAALLAAGGAKTARPAVGLPALSERERELVTLVAQGRTNAQIAGQLFISVRTVGSHLDRIRDKTGCRRRADLTRLALQAGLV